MYKPRGYFHISRSGEGGGLGSHIKIGGKIWGQVHQIRGKTWEVLLPQDTKVGGKSQFWSKYEIQRAKFGVFVIYTFGGKIWSSNKNFRGKFWGQGSPTS